jgi:hypothetical protein
MFWIGFCAGVSAAFLILIAGISAIGWGVGKERTKAAAERQALMDYWRQSMENQQGQIAVLENIEMSIRNRV